MTPSQAVTRPETTDSSPSSPTVPDKADAPRPPDRAQASDESPSRLASEPETGDGSVGTANAGATAQPAVGPRDPRVAGLRPQTGGARYQRLLSQALEDPVVKNILDRFGGRIVEIKEVP